MNARKLVETNIGKPIQEAMARHPEYHLADFIERLLYMMKEVNGNSPVVTPSLQMPLNLWVNCKALKYPGLDDKGEYADVQRTLREIHDTLLLAALKKATS